jgi:hypothetical protein
VSADTDRADESLFHQDSPHSLMGTLLQRKGTRQPDQCQQTQSRRD